MKEIKTETVLGCMEAKSLCTAGDGEAEPDPAPASAASEAVHHIGHLGPPGPFLAGTYLISHCPRDCTSTSGASGDSGPHWQGCRRRPLSGLLALCCRCHPLSPPLQVLSQLEACGLVETIHISAAGFPIR